MFQTIRSQARGSRPAMSAAPTTAPRRGRPAAASREDVLDAATHRYLRGQRVDVQAIAPELGVGRTTIYRWFGTREELIGDVLVRVTEPLLQEARAGARGRGAAKILDTFDRFNRSLVDAPALRRFVEREREPATLGYAIVRLGEAFIFNEAAAGMRGDVARLREVETALLGVRESR